MKKSLRPTAKTLWQLFLSTLYISAFTFCLCVIKKQ